MNSPVDKRNNRQPIPYKDILILRIIAILCCLIQVWTFALEKQFNSFEPVIRYQFLMNRSTFISDINLLLKIGMIILYCGLAFIFIANHVLYRNKHKLAPMNDILSSSLYLTGSLFYIVFCNNALKWDFLYDIFSSLFALSLLVMVIILVIYIALFNRYKSVLFTPNKTASSISWSIIVLLIIGSGFFFGSATAKAVQFAPTYGEYGQSIHIRDTSVEDNYFGNQRYEGAITDDGLYFINYNTNSHSYQILHYEETTSSVFYESLAPISTLYYANGYLFFVELDNEIYNLKCINIMSHEIHVLDSKNWILGFGIRDNSLYYLCGDTLDQLEIIRCPVQTPSEKHLYLGNVNSIYFLFSESSFKNMILFNDIYYLSNIGDVIQKTDQQYQGRYYGQYKSNGPTTFISLYEIPAALRCHNQNEEMEIAPNVTAYNIWKDQLFYATTTDNGYELFQSDLDGNNPICVTAEEDGWRINKIYMMENRIVITLRNIENEQEDIKIQEFLLEK